MPRTSRASSAPTARSPGSTRRRSRRSPPRRASVPFAEGDAILIEDGAPADALYVIAAGSVELVHEEEVIDILEPGEVFGHPSLLTGRAPAFTVRAHEPTRCYVIAARGRDGGARAARRRRLRRARRCASG